MTMTDQRVIRVFVSSTFRDMQEERDELIKRTFPQLRKLCEERGVTWGEVDLRWGITEEQSQRGEVLPICMAEIERCRPYFIGLLGERYGWVPDQIPREVINQEPWLSEHLHRSVTELEILHGVLDNPAMAGHALFYFRDPSFIDSLTREQRSDFLEMPTDDDIARFGLAEAERRADDRKRKLASLKDRIRRNGLTVRENYPNPEELGRMVLRDLTEVIDELYPGGLKQDVLDRNARDHEAFVLSRAQVYIGRQEYFDRLDEHARGNGPPLVVIGESGSGKSALLANWVRHYDEILSDAAPAAEESRWRRFAAKFRPTSGRNPQSFLLTHFIGATSESADWAAMLRRIMAEANRRSGIDEVIPDQPDALRTAFANWLHKIPSRGRVILIFDALNQLEDRDGAQDLGWLPTSIPSGVRLILSTLPGRALDEINRRDWPTLAVGPLEVDARKRLVTEYLAQAAKQVSPAQLERIASASQSGNPLWLRVVLDELRVFGSYESLDARIDYYLTALSVEDLYQKVLERYEQDYERDRPGLVGDSMSLIWAARRGLSGAELLQLLGENDEPLPRAHWSPLYLAAEASLLTRSGLVGIGHDYLRRAIRDRYLSREPDQQTKHLRLADYFAARGFGPRNVEEVPWQLARAREWQRLSTVLSDPPYFRAVWEYSAFEAKAYWAQIEQHSSIRAVDVYQPVLNSPAQHSDDAWNVAMLLSETGHAAEAQLLLGYVSERFEQAEDLRMYGSLGDEANTHYQLGNLDLAMHAYQELERVARKSGNTTWLSAALNNQGLILYDRGDLDGALKLHKKDEKLCRDGGNRALLQVCLGNQGNIFYARGDHKSAMSLYKEKERLCRELGDQEALGMSLANQAVILREEGRLDDAMTLLKQQERICRDLSNQARLAKCLGNQGLVLKDRGEVDAAMSLHLEQERICRETGDLSGLQFSLGSQANILRERNEFERAMKRLVEQEEICRKLGDSHVLQDCLGDQAIILQELGEFPRALQAAQEQEEICRELQEPVGLTKALATQALLILTKRMGSQQEALPLLEEAYGLALDMQPDVAREIGNLLEDLRSRIRRG